MEHLRRLGNRITVPIDKDEDGYLGRECPVSDCEGYFKITPGTGIKEPAPCHCPYCGHSGESNTFFTKEQIEYAKSVVMRKVVDAVRADLKSLEFQQPAAPHPIRYYREKELETEVICDNCTLRYAIYGVFGWCPDCGIHNSLQILSKNLEFVRKELALSDSAEREFADHLIGDALENIVSAFDGFGREICARKGVDTHFQNIGVARRKIQDAFGLDFADVVTSADWDEVCRVFQKRHLLAHNMGVVDQEYIKKANDPHAVLGRKITVSRDEVTATIGLIEALGKRLFDGIIRVP